MTVHFVKRVKLSFEFYRIFILQDKKYNGGAGDYALVKENLQFSYTT